MKWEKLGIQELIVNKGAQRHTNVMEKLKFRIKEKGTHSGTCLWSQLFRRLRQENGVNLQIENQSKLHNETLSQSQLNDLKH